MPRYLIPCYSGCVSVRVFLDEGNIWISRLREADCPHQGGWTSSHPLKAWIEQKDGIRKTLLSLSDCLWAETLIFSSLQSRRGSWTRTWTGTSPTNSPGSQVFRLEPKTIPLSLLGLQLVDCRLWEFSVSITIWTNDFSITLHIHVPPVSSVSLENPD